MATNQWHQIFDHIGEAAAWEMLAEEASELAAASSKLARIVRGENPSRTDWPDGYAKVVEECADILNALGVLDSGLADRGLHPFLEAPAIQPRKMTRWYYSLFGEGANQDA